MTARVRNLLLLMLALLYVAGPAMATDWLKKMESLNIPKPEAALKRLSIKSISLQEIQLLLETSVDNPYPLGLPKLGLDAGMNIEGTRLFKSSTQPVSIGAKQTASVPFNVGLKYQDLVNIYKKVKGKEALQLSMDGNLQLPLPVQKLQAKGLFFKGMPQKLSFPFKAQHLLPSVLPAIALRGFKILQPTTDDIKSAVNSDAIVQTVSSYVDSLLNPKKKNPGAASKAGLSSVDFPINTEFQLVLTNSAAAKVLFEALNYELYLGKEKFLGGQSTKIENKGQESIVTVKTAFPIKSVSSGIAAAIKAHKAVYQLKGSSGLDVPALAADAKVPFNFDQKGNLSW